MPSDPIVSAALAARTAGQAEAVQQLIAQKIGAVYQRPVGDRWGNQGMLTGSGASYDHKALEVVTNMQDAVMVRKAMHKYLTVENVPYSSPHEAADALLKDLPPREQAKLASVYIDQGSDKKSITMVCRDRGIGMPAAAVPRTIFQIGSSGKDGVDWQQGTFGMGGATTFRNANSVVLVTRPAPELIATGAVDEITVAVVQWERRHTTVNAFYLVTSPWSGPGAVAAPYSVLASAHTDFEPGTQLALIDYSSQGLGVRSGDERSFDTVLNTRLYDPVMAVGYQNNTSRDDPRFEILDGLRHRLERNPGAPGTEGQQKLPFNYGGTTYQLPVRFRIFTEGRKAGARRTYAAKGHVLVITSNGQVHSHWDQDQFKRRTKLSKLHERIFVVVESDALPVELRTELFTADRTQLVQSAAAIRLEKEIAAFLDDWPALRDANNALIKEAITGDSSGRPTLDIAQKISRALKAKGFSLGGTGKTGGGHKPPEPTPEKELFDDPTQFAAPQQVTAVQGQVKGVYFKLNAKDEFFADGRGELLISCDHPEIGEDEVTVGELHAGRIRVSVAVPDDFIGTYTLSALIPEWSKASGGLGDPFHCTTTFHVVAENTPGPTGKTGAGRETGSKGAEEGALVALVWSDEKKHGGEWNPTTVGEIEMVPAKELAAGHKEYKELVGLDVEIPTVVLNTTYTNLKNYISARAAQLTDTGRDQARDRYAVGVGVALLLQDQERTRAEKAGDFVSDATYRAVADSAARAVLAVMPAYDQLAKEAGIDE